MGLVAITGMVNTVFLVGSLDALIDKDGRILSLGVRSSPVSWCRTGRTIKGYEAMHAIRKGQVRWVRKGDAVAQRQFIHAVFGIAA